MKKNMFKGLEVTHATDCRRILKGGSYKMCNEIYGAEATKEAQRKIAAFLNDGADITKIYVFWHGKAWATHSIYLLTLKVAMCIAKDYSFDLDYVA